MHTGGQLVVRTLETQNVKRVFCVPGESYLPVLDALYDSEIFVTVCRQEGGAAMMAEAFGKLEGAPGICFVTRGPGATNAASGVHVAAQDSTPMILFVGQIDASHRHREAFQEVDYRHLFGDMAKWVAEIDSAARVPEMICRAFRVASTGRPGPVVLVLPENILTDSATSPSVSACQPADSWPAEHQMRELSQLLTTAMRPAVIVGGSRWTAEAVTQLREFAERFELPVACSFRRQMLFDHLHPCYAGDAGLGINPELKQRLEQADVLLLLGGRLAEIPSQSYTLLDIPTPRQTLIHVHPGAEELGKVYQAHITVQASPSAFMHSASKLQPEKIVNWHGEAALAHQSYVDWSSLDQAHPDASMMKTVIQHLRDVLPDNAVLTNGAGNYATWIHRFWRFRQFGSQLAPTSGSMGYGLPAAIAAKLHTPEKTVICLAGDGCYQMTSQEFGTAVQENAAVIVLVIDNGMYGTIRMHQEQHFPGRVSATNLVNPDFAQMARAYGVFAASVNSAEEFPAAFDAALESGTAALLHIKTEAHVITPTQVLSQV